MDITAIKVTPVHGSYIDYSIVVPFYLKLHGNLQKSPSGVSETIHVGYCVLYCIFPKLTSDVVLRMDWLHAINPLINWNAYSLYLDYGGDILGTKKGCYCAFDKVCTLKLVLNIMYSDTILAWFGIIRP